MIEKGRIWGLDWREKFRSTFYVMARCAEMQGVGTVASWNQTVTDKSGYTRRNQVFSPHLYCVHVIPKSPSGQWHARLSNQGGGLLAIIRQSAWTTWLPLLHTRRYLERTSVEEKSLFMLEDV